MHRSIGVLSAGFTFIEVMIVVAIAAILVTVAFPSFVAMIDRENADSVANDLAQSFALVRSAAIKTGSPIVICASSDQATCSNQWADGWIAFVDENRSSTFDASEIIVLTTVNESASAQVSVENIAGDSLNSVRFNYRGAPSSVVSASVSKGATSVSVAVSAFGKPRKYD